MPTDPRSLLPLKAVELELLLALAEEELHGYGLTLAVAERSAGVIRLEPGNLYRIIRRLLADGLVAESDRRPARDLEDARRRYYRLTTLGERVVAAELQRLQARVRSAAGPAGSRRWATRASAASPGSSAALPQASAIA
jgi:DNA-binding PadR family transcriptional regulator